MPDAGASRKRQIQVTPGPFSDATALGAAGALVAHVYRGLFEDIAISNAAGSMRCGRSGTP